MADNVFRTATPVQNPAVVVRQEAKNPDVPTGEGVAPPIALHEEIKGKPYSATYFEITQYKDMPESLKMELSMIDRAYRTRVEKGLKDGEATFKEMIKEAETVTDTKLTNHNIKIKKIAEYLRFIERLEWIDEAEKEKDGNSEEKEEESF